MLEFFSFWQDDATSFIDLPNRFISLHIFKASIIDPTPLLLVTRLIYKDKIYWKYTIVIFIVRIKNNSMPSSLFLVRL